MKIAIVADQRRGDMGLKLAEKVNADYLSVDQGDLGCSGNHLAAWRTLVDIMEPGDTHAVVLEDDAVPVDGFREQLASALSVAPAPIVSLYLGMGYISDPQVGATVEKATAIGAHWIVTQGRVLHAVGLAIRCDLLPPMLEGVHGRMPIDQELSRWARSNSHAVAYTNGSLVDHDDVPSLVCRYRRPERRAWRVGGNDPWTNTAMPMY